jgi:hypothetical protein
VRKPDYGGGQNRSEDGFKSFEQPIHLIFGLRSTASQTGRRRQEGRRNSQ